MRKRVNWRTRTARAFKELFENEAQPIAEKAVQANLHIRQIPRFVWNETGNNDPMFADLVQFLATSLRRKMKHELSTDADADANWSLHDNHAESCPYCNRALNYAVDIACYTLPDHAEIMRKSPLYRQKPDCHEFEWICKWCHDRKSWFTPDEFRARLSKMRVTA